MILPGIPYLVGSAALAGALLAGGGVWKVMDWRCDAARTASVERAIEQMHAIEEQNDAISSRFENDRIKVRTEFRTIYEAVDSTPGPSSADCKFPPAWVWAWHAANHGAGDAAGKPDYSLSGASASLQRGAQGNVSEPRLGSAGVPRVPGEAQGADRLDKGWFE